MSNEQDKFNHSRRLLKDKNAVARQLKIAKTLGNQKYLDQPHRLEKHHAMDCGQPGCIMCGNPRRTMNEKTIQEQRFEQPEKDTFDPDSQT
jgi:hypothetical protein